MSQFDFFDHSDRANPILIGMPLSSHIQKFLLITSAGEYAIVQPNEAGQSGVDWSEARSPFPFWIGTVAEAVFLIGAERNADVILGALYVRLWRLSHGLKSILMLLGAYSSKFKCLAVDSRSDFLHC